MRSRNIWIAAALLYFASMQVLLYQAAVWERAGEGWPPFVIKTGYALIHGGFGVVLLGAIARLAPRAGAGLWRPWMLIGGTLLMMAGMWLQSRISGPPMTLDLGMAGLLGLAVAALLPRLLPEAVARRWLGMERRGLRTED
jgi:hypothetical protein